MSYRTRVLGAAYEGVPAEDVFCLVHPAQYLHVLRYAFDANSPQAADDGLEFVNVLPLKSPDVVRPAAARRRGARRGREGSKMMSERAAGMLQEIAKAMENVRSGCGRAVFGRRLFAFEFQTRFLGAARKLRDTMAPLLPSGPNAVDRRLSEPFEGNWPLPLSCRGCKPTVSAGKETATAQDWRPDAGCPERRRHVQLVIRGVTRLACRLGTLDNPSRN